MKKFNTTGPCVPSEHYMVKLDERMEKIRKLVDEGKYFTINRARQYGKTTTMRALSKYLQKDYIILGLDFQKISNGNFSTEELFVKAFCRQLVRTPSIRRMIPGQSLRVFREILDRRDDPVLLDELFFDLSDWCMSSEKPIVLMIDEVDSAANNQVFFDFLAQLRALYIDRKDDPEGNFTFKSVILAGVSDIKHLKSSMQKGSQNFDPDIRQMSSAQAWKKVNSPWNIAADFMIDMSLPEAGIREMLAEYEDDHGTGMDVAAIAKQIHDYTNGYPYLVSRICQKLDESMVPGQFQSFHEAWTAYGVDEAVKMILSEGNNALFDSLTGKLANYPEIRSSLYRILMYGESITFNAYQEEHHQMFMYGFIREGNGKIIVSNRIFETMLYNLFLSDDEMKSNAFSRKGAFEKNIFVEDGILNMRLILEHFIDTYTEIYGSLEDKFKEEDGRKFFLLYLKPIINGTGNYYIEAQTRDHTRTDIIIDYLGKRTVIELKIWHGERYNEKGEKQIIDYLDYYGLSTGYMLSFNFNKKKEHGVHPVHIGEKVLFEGTV